MKFEKNAIINQIISKSSRMRSAFRGAIVYASIVNFILVAVFFYRPIYLIAVFFHILVYFILIAVFLYLLVNVILIALLVNYILIAVFFLLITFVLVIVDFFLEDLVFVGFLVGECFRHHLGRALRRVGDFLHERRFPVCQLNDGTGTRMTVVIRF